MSDTLVSVLLWYIAIGAVFWMFAFVGGQLENWCAVAAARRGRPSRTWMLWAASVFTILAWPRWAVMLIGGIVAGAIGIVRGRA